MAVVRSPNYPAISLPEAIERVEKIFQKAQKNPVHKDVLATYIGYGGWNGASSLIISALYKYGLLEIIGNKGQYKVSKEAIDILMNEPGEHERVEAIQKAAFTPTLFSELHNYYGESLPGDQNIRKYLVNKNFNTKTLDIVIRAYRDTIELVNVETQGSNAESVVEQQQEPPMQTQPVYQTSTSPNSAVSSLPEKGVGEKVWSFDLSEDCSIKMVLTGHVTKEALENLKAYIDISIKTAPRASVKQPLLFEEDIDHHENE